MPKTTKSRHLWLSCARLSDIISILCINIYVYVYISFFSTAPWAGLYITIEVSGFICCRLDGVADCNCDHSLRPAINLTICLVQTHTHTRTHTERERKTHTEVYRHAKCLRWTIYGIPVPEAQMPKAQQFVER